MYNKFILALSVAFSLSACSAGAQQESTQGNIAAASINAPVQDARQGQSAQNEHSYTVSFQGQTGSVEGYGKDSQEAAYDALAYMASNVWKPGSDSHRAMLTEQGLSVLMVEEGNVQNGFHAVVKIGKQGLVIDVVKV